MKTLLICAAFLCPLVAHAQKPPFTQEQQNFCISQASVFRDTAGMRDGGAPPLMALNGMAGYKMISKKRVKEIVNTVYFNPNFVGAAGESLFNQIYEACLYPKGRYQPLK
jgi:hypothetical protein